MRVALPRSRETSPQAVDLAMWRFLIAFPLIAGISYPISKLGSGLLAFASLLIVPGLLNEAIKTSWSKKRYARTPGILIHNRGVTVYGDGGPTYHEWPEFREASVSWDGESIIHDRVARDALKDSFAQRDWGNRIPIDHVLATPDEILNAIKNHPKSPLWQVSER